VTLRPFSNCFPHNLSLCQTPLVVMTPFIRPSRWGMYPFLRIRPLADLRIRDLTVLTSFSWCPSPPVSWSLLVFPASLPCLMLVPRSSAPESLPSHLRSFFFHPLCWFFPGLSAVYSRLYPVHLSHIRGRPPFPFRRSAILPPCP